MESSPSNGPRTHGHIPCPHCGQFFSRKEHLDRHLHRHSGARLFRCSVCSKSFSRRDTLARHRTIHVSLAELDSSRSHPTTLQRGSQACQECAKAKHRCHGGQPCQRCVRRSLSCQFDSRPRPSKVTIRQPSDTDGTVSEPRSPVSNNVDISHRPNTQINVEDLLSSRQSLPPQELHLQYEETLITPSNSFAMDVTAVQNSLLPSEYNSVAAPPGNSLDGCSIWQPAGQYSVDPIFWGFEDFDSAYSHIESTDFTENSCSPPEPRRSAQHPSNYGDDACLQVPGPSGHNATSLPTPGANTLYNLPPPDLEDFEIIQREDSGHVHSVNPAAYYKLCSFMENHIDVRTSQIPSFEFFHSFVQLYFEYFDTMFPIIHPSALGDEDASWLLLLAVSAIGCQYSAVKHQTEIATALFEVLRRAIRCEMPDPLQIRSLAFVQSIFLRDIRMLFSGSRKQQLRMQYERNTLVTLFRSLAQIPFGRETIPKHGSIPDRNSQDWQSWLKSESMTRLLNSIFCLDFLQMVLLELQPMCNMRDRANCTAIDDKLWECQEASIWEAEMRSRKEHLVLSQQTDQTLPPSISQSVPSLALYTQERLFLDNLNMLTRPGSILSTRLADSMPIPVASIQQLASPFTAAVDNEFHMSKFAPNTEPLFRITSISRRVPLRVLYAFSGWQAPTNEIEESVKSLQIWMQANGEQARECLWHAAVVFSTLRGQTYLTCYAPLCMLIAALYIWAYDKLSLHHMSNSDTRASSSTIRIDCLQDSSRVEKWINGELGTSRIHIKQVGILNGSDSILRLLLELERTLLSQTAWHGLCGGLAFAVREIIEGGLPSHKPE